MSTAENSLKIYTSSPKATATISVVFDALAKILLAEAPVRDVSSTSYFKDLTSQGFLSSLLVPFDGISSEKRTFVEWYWCMYTMPTESFHEQGLMLVVWRLMFTRQELQAPRRSTAPMAPPETRAGRVHSQHRCSHNQRPTRRLAWIRTATVVKLWG